MRKFLLLLLTGATIIACNNSKTSDKTSKEEKDTTIASTTTPGADPVSPLKQLEEILGSFVGAFGDNKITMLITKVTGDSIAGRSIVGGNDRPFNGTYRYENGMYNVSAKEPGDHKDDGVFSFSISKANLNEVTGTWKPNDLKRPAKDYALQRKIFEYKMDVGDYPEASQRLLKPTDVENMMKEDLEFMRNEIFARHGYCFNKKNLRQQFEMQDWYVPNTVDIKGFLTEIEKKNIAMIKRYEKYAEEYGDEYGR
ncbi:MAG: YARHG domain-containing protein [Chitinophagaceae bacterium]